MKEFHSIFTKLIADVYARLAIYSLLM